jgi:hypothetical protein
MYTTKKIFLVFLLLASFSIAFGKKVSKRADNPIVLSRENLTNLRDGGIGDAVRKGLEKLIKRKKECAKCEEPFEGANRHGDLYERDFLAVRAEENGFGGYNALIVFRGHPKVFNLWLYDLGERDFQIRDMEPIRPTLNRRLMTELDRKVYARYWLSPKVPGKKNR